MGRRKNPENPVTRTKEADTQNIERPTSTAELIVTPAQFKSVEEKLLRATRLNTFISQVNQNIVRVKDEALLYKNACNIALEFGKFKMAWIGLFDREKKTISLVEQCGIAKEVITLFRDGSLQNKGPQASILQTGNYYVCNDIEKDVNLNDLKTFALKNGIRSCMVLPIKKSGNIIGTFNLYASELNFFGNEEIKLMVEVAGDISFAIDLFEREKKQKDTEALLLHSEKRYRALIEHDSDMKTLSNREGKIFYGSPSISKWLGYEMEEFLLKYPEDLIHPDDIEEYLKERTGIMGTDGQSFHFRQRRLHKNGNWIWCEGTVTNMLNEPAIQAMVSNFTDISEKVSREMESEFETNNLNALINNTRDLMWSVDRNFNLITSNVPFDEMGIMNFGRSISKGESVLSAAYSTEMSKHFRQLYERAFAGESFTETEHFDFPYELWTEISYYPIRKGDTVIGTACHSRDMTERKRDEKKLMDSESKYRSLIEQASDAIIVVNAKGSILEINTRTEKLFGYNRNQLLKMELRNLLFPTDSPARTDEIAKGKTVVYERRMKRKNETAIDVEVSARMISDGSILGIFRDVSERKAGELERKKMIADIAKRNRDLEQFTFIISHNLRAPAANIIGFTEMLQDKRISSSEQQAFLKGLSVSVKNLDTVIKDINKILEINKKDDVKELVYFSKLINDILISISNLADKYHVRIKQDFSKVDEIYSIKGYLHSIFYNLITNSIKYRKPDEPLIIEIKSRKENRTIIITFKDNGSGIDMKTKAGEVFKLYKRFHTHVEGKGMGLFMVKTQVESLGGNISIESELNKGTQFTIEFEN